MLCFFVLVIEFIFFALLSITSLTFLTLTFVIMRNGLHNQVY